MATRRKQASTRRKPSYTRQAAHRRKRFQVRSAIMLIIIAAAVLLAAHSFLIHGNGNRLNAPAQVDLTTVVTDPDLQEKIIRYKGMTVSFNPHLHIPNWVAWELTADEANGTVSRSNKFLTDPDVEGCADPSDYTNSGYDRGHMAPAGDMKWDLQAMDETFFMTNICPQAGELNRGSWKSLEEKCRARTACDSTLIIVCGPVLKGPDPIIGTIGDNNVAAPRQFFKVILSPRTDPPVAIGFIMPNGKVPGGMQQCAMTVDEVEALTGHDFFSALPDSIEDIVESTVNFNRWSRLK